MGEGLNSKSAQDGQTFTGTLANGIAVNGQVVIPAGAGVTGVVSEAKSAGRFKGEAILAIRLTSINVHGAPTNLGTDEYCVTQKGKGKRSAVMIGGGAGGGALIGGIAGGGKGALIGGLVGAGAGTAGAAFTGNKELDDSGRVGGQLQDHHFAHSPAIRVTAATFRRAVSLQAR